LDDLVPPLGVVTEDRHDLIFTFGEKPISGPGRVKGALKGACKNAGMSYGRRTSNGIIMHDSIPHLGHVVIIQGFEGQFMFGFFLAEYFK
jgi:hypothetical protein